MSRTEQVREYYKRIGSARPAACAQATGISKPMVYKCVRELTARGWLTKDPHIWGLYHFTELPKDQYGRTEELQTKLWRAVRMSRRFKAFDIAQLSGATLNYAQRYIQFLRGCGHIEKIGMDGHTSIYRVAADAPAKTPRMRTTRIGKEENKNQEIINWGLDLIQAVRSGDILKAKQANRYIGEALWGKFMPGETMGGPC